MIMSVKKIAATATVIACALAAPVRSEDSGSQGKTGDWHAVREALAEAEMAHPERSGLPSDFRQLERKWAGGESEGGDNPKASNSQGEASFGTGLEFKLVREVEQPNDRDMLKPEDEQAQYELALRYLEGDGVERSAEKAAHWFEKAAEQGNAEAQFELGMSLASTADTFEKGKFWLVKAGESGHLRAQKMLAGILLGLAGDTRSDDEVVESWLQQAAYWLEQAANQGDKSAQYILGDSYAQGVGVAQSEEKAALWFRASAEQGHAGAQLELALMYTKGEGVKQSDELAVRWYQKAAKGGDVRAQNMVAMMYWDGHPLEQSYDKAVYWLTNAAEQGDIEAQFRLGVCYAKGRGVERSDEKAGYWLKKAAEQGSEDARRALEALRAGESGR